MKGPLTERLLSRITVDENGCWNYPLTSGNGYGVIGAGGRGGKVLRTHRVLYEYYVGPIPLGMELDHLCRNRACCNVAHLEPVTRAENIRRGKRKTGQTHCKNGHEFTPENTKRTARQRICIECARRASREWARRQRQQASAWPITSIHESAAPMRWIHG